MDDIKTQEDCNHSLQHQLTFTKLSLYSLSERIPSDWWNDSSVRSGIVRRTLKPLENFYSVLEGDEDVKRFTNVDGFQFNL